MPTSISTTALLLAFALSTTGYAAEKFWLPPLGGSFTATSSWSGGSLPGPSDHAIFGQSGVTAPFDVTFPSTPAWVSELTIANQTPRFLLGSSGTPQELHVVNQLRIRSGTPGNPVTFIGGTLFAKELFVGFDGSANSGYATLANVNASCTDFSVGFGSPGAIGVVTLSAGATLHKLACCDGSVGAGSGNTGTLNVDAGVLIHDWALRVGRDGGVGNLNVSNQGHVEIGSSLPLIIGNGSGQMSIGSCSVTSGGSISSADIPIGIGDQAVGTMIVDGASIEATTISVGLFKGSGLLTIANGAQIACGNLAVGDSGTGVLNASGSTTLVKGMAAVGVNGADGPHGTVNFSGGCHVSSLRPDNTGHFVFLGIGAGAQGVANVVGPGTLWDGIDWLTIGGVYHTNTGGTGELHISDAARVICLRGIVAERPADTGLVTVVGAGSEWSVGGEIVLGDFNGDGGDGTVEIRDGGRVSCVTFGMGQSGKCNVAIGPNSGSSAVVASGTAVLAGSLVVSIEAGFVPSPGTAFPLIQASSFTGAFASVTLPPNMVLETVGSQLRVVQLDTITGIAITPDPIMPIIGIATQLSAIGQFAGGGTVDLSVQAAWSVGNPSIASISAGGTIVALTTGSTTVTATYEGLSASADVIVAPLPDPLPTERISVAAGGEQGNLGSSDYVYVSPDGRSVVFASAAQNLVSPPTSGIQLFLKDTMTGVVELLSQSSAGVAGNGTSLAGSMSDDGRFVVFESNATNLTDVAPGATPQVYLRDRQSSTTVAVSVTPGGAWGNGGSGYPRISGSGRYVVFQSSATDLVMGDTNGQVDVFRHDLMTGLTVLVSVGDGAPANGASDFGAIDATGRFVVFSSAASNLVPRDTNGEYDIFLKDMDQGDVERLSVGPDGEQSIGGGSRVAEISSDGSIVGFLSFATNLVPGGSNSDRQVYVRDVAGGETVMASRTETGDPSVGGSGSLSISGDGRYAAFRVLGGLVAEDTNGFDDVYRFATDGSALELISTALSGGGSNGSCSWTGLDGTGATIVFNSDASNLVPFDTNGLRDTFLRRLSVAVVGDLDGDGSVGAADLAILLGAWGTKDPVADLDGDGAVGASDLAILLGAWG